MGDSHGAWKSKNASRRMMETVSAKSSGKAMASQVGGPCGGSAKNLKASRLGGRSDTRQHRGGRVAAVAEPT
jgi:hypothetical protein